MRTPTKLLTLAAATGLVAAAATSAPASAAPRKHPRTTWAPAATATIHPGVQMYTEGAQCTANFVYTDRSGKTYVGYAAHCAGTGEATDTDGCQAASLPLGTKVDFVEGGSLLTEGTRVGGGTLVYSSWLTMQERGETDADTCAYNDLALVKVERRRRRQGQPVDPVLGWTGRCQRRRHGGGGHRPQLWQLEPACGRRGALAQAGHQPRHRGRRLVAPGLHRDAGRPR